MKRFDLAAMAILPALILLVIHPTDGGASCPRGGIPEDPNVVWMALSDSVAACPAGDSVLAGRPSRVRGVVFYGDDCHDPRAGVPPESIWVALTSVSGNVGANDESEYVYADDSTDADGMARITLPSLSGCGRLKLSLYVSGVAYDELTISVRTNDTDASGRTESGDGSSVCDMNYNGHWDVTDLNTVQSHAHHWRRNALHGTPVRRTNLLETGVGYEANHIGAGGISWEPNGRRIAFSLHTAPYGDCAIYLVTSGGLDTLRQLSFPATWVHDYNPSWSPRRFEVVWDRGDTALFRKGVPGIAEDWDTTEVELSPVPRAGDDVQPAFSPDGRTVAFARLANGALHIWTIPISGGDATQVTNETEQDFNPQWAPDGRSIIFERAEATGKHALYQVAADGSQDAVLIYSPATLDTHAVTPAYGPDGKIVTHSVGQSVHTIRTLDPGLTNPPSILNYGWAPGMPSRAINFPRVSPDGTRLAYITKQLWAVRRNMNHAPTMGAIGDRVIEEGDSISFTVTASDHEDDPLSFVAYYLRDSLGMDFDSLTQVFAWRTPSGSAGNSYWIPFYVSDGSGGTDWEVVKLSVIAHGGAAPQGITVRAEDDLRHGNPSRTGFGMRADCNPGTEAVLFVYQANGREIAEVQGACGAVLTWDGTNRDGVRARPGLYYYRLLAGAKAATGKWVLLR